MIRIKASDLNALARALQGERKRIRSYVDTEFTLAVREVFSDIVTHSPQYTGNVASNWHVGLTAGSEYTNYKAGFIGDPYSMGDNPAVGRSASRMADRYVYGVPVFIYNNTPYAEMIDTLPVPDGGVTRPVNLIGGQVYMLLNQVPIWRSMGLK